MLAMVAAFSAAALLVLADSGLRLWSALGGIETQRRAMSNDGRFQPHPRLRPAARMTTRVSYARPGQVQAAAQRAVA